MPKLIEPAEGCRFAGRCKHVTAACVSATPPLVEVAPGHKVACVLHATPMAQKILAHKISTATLLCESLVAAGSMRASAAELRAVSTNMAVIATYWLSFEYARDPRGTTENERIGRGVYQVMAMISPFLIDEARALLERLSVAYLKP